MKISKLVTIVGLVTALGFSNYLYAHHELGTLGSNATATDKWYVICNYPTNATLSFQLRRTAGTPCVRATLNNTGTTLTSCGTWTPLTRVNTGSGAKFFTINKNPAKFGAVSYTVRTLCADKFGIENPPNNQSYPQTYIQNQ